MKIMPIPAGTRDVLPAEAAELRCLKDAIRGVFESFAYGEVITPTLEMEAALEAAGEKRFLSSFRLFDERGDVLVMRPEMTTPIARLVATKMADREAPFRLCYFANSFRPTSPQRGRQSEFWQAGLELIGFDSPAMDAEALAVLCAVLDACGLKDYSVGLGEASFFRSLLDSAGVTGAGRDAIFDTLVRRDMVQLADLVDGMDISDDDRTAIMDVTALRGGSEVLTRAQDLVRGPAMDEALKRLARTYYLVSRYGYAGRILFDLGIFRNFDYYTGVVFEVYSGDLGFPIGGGGRYDGLLEKFGRPAPAVGFAIGLDRLHIAVSGQGNVAVSTQPSAVLVDGLDKELDLANELRERGVAVFSIPGDTGEEGSRRAAAENGTGFVVLPEAGGFRLLDLGGGAARELSREELLRELTG